MVCQCQKTIRDAVAELPEEARPVFLRLWALTAMADTGDGDLTWYLTRMLQVHAAYRGMLEEKVEMLNKVQAVLEGKI